MSAVRYSKLILITIILIAPLTALCGKSKNKQRAKRQDQDIDAIVRELDANRLIFEGMFKGDGKKETLIAHLTKYSSDLRFLDTALSRTNAIVSSLKKLGALITNPFHCRSLFLKFPMESIEDLLFFAYFTAVFKPGGKKLNLHALTKEQAAVFAYYSTSKSEPIALAANFILSSKEADLQSWRISNKIHQLNQFLQADAPNVATLFDPFSQRGITSSPFLSETCELLVETLKSINNCFDLIEKEQGLSDEKKAEPIEHYNILSIENNVEALKRAADLIEALHGDWIKGHQNLHAKIIETQQQVVHDLELLKNPTEKKKKPQKDSKPPCKILDLLQQPEQPIKPEAPTFEPTLKKILTAPQRLVKKLQYHVGIWYKNPERAQREQGYLNSRWNLDFVTATHSLPLVLFKFIAQLADTCPWISTKRNLCTLYTLPATIICAGQTENGVIEACIDPEGICFHFSFKTQSLHEIRKAFNQHQFTTESPQLPLETDEAIFSIQETDEALTIKEFPLLFKIDDTQRKLQIVIPKGDALLLNA